MGWIRLGNPLVEHQLGVVRDDRSTIGRSDRDRVERHEHSAFGASDHARHNVDGAGAGVGHHGLRRYDL